MSSAAQFHSERSNGSQGSRTRPRMDGAYACYPTVDSTTFQDSKQCASRCAAVGATCSDQTNPIVSSRQSRPDCSGAIATRQRSSNECRRIPWIFVLECAIEIVDADEVRAIVGGLADEIAEVHEHEHDVADVRRRAHTPVLEHHLRHHTVHLEREIANGECELAAGDVAALREMRLRILERLQ